LVQLNIKKDKMEKVHESKAMMNTLQLFTGMSRKDINKDIKEKIMVLNWMAKKDINTVDHVGRIMAEYYTNNKELMKIVRSNKSFIFISSKEEEDEIQNKPTKAPIKGENKKKPKNPKPNPRNKKIKASSLKLKNRKRVSKKKK
ncbi:MAG: hypothetical protein PHV16_01745, partial [Candidatus Nanoarchaeia archaeon]|nr:hypothetical protein [Candidatus Nanoarchaeia archaeon]